MSVKKTINKFGKWIILLIFIGLGVYWFISGFKEGATSEKPPSVFDKNKRTATVKYEWYHPGQAITIGQSASTDFCVIPGGPDFLHKVKNPDGSIFCHEVYTDKERIDMLASANRDDKKIAEKFLKMDVPITSSIQYPKM